MEEEDAKTNAAIEREIARYAALTTTPAGYRQLVEWARVASNNCRDWTRTLDDEGGFFSSGSDETKRTRRFWCTVASSAAALVKERRPQVQGAEQIERETLEKWDARDRKIEDLEAKNTGFWSLETLTDTVKQGGNRAAEVVKGLLARVAYWFGLAAEMPGSDRAAGLTRLAIASGLAVGALYLAYRAAGLAVGQYAGAVSQTLRRTQQLADSVDARAAAALGV